MKSGWFYIAGSTRRIGGGLASESPGHQRQGVKPAQRKTIKRACVHKGYAPVFQHTHIVRKKYIYESCVTVAILAVLSLAFFVCRALLIWQYPLSIIL